MIESLKKAILENYKANNNVKVHISRLDTDKEYDALIGLWVNGELTETYEIENTNNKELDLISDEITTLIRQNTLYLI